MATQEKCCGTCGRWKPGVGGFIGECGIKGERTPFDKICDIGEKGETLVKELARLIRKGLAQKGVKEEPLVWGAGVVKGRVEANVIGLALIGKLGVEAACQLFENSLDEAFIGKGGPNIQKILQELGLSDTIQTEELAALHNEKNAEQIAQMLETGQLTL